MRIRKDLRKIFSYSLVGGIFVFAGVMAYPQLVFASGESLSGYLESGQRSSADDYEEGTSGDYTYRNYHLKFAQKLSDQLNYDLSSFVYDKDYDQQDDLDNLSRVLKTNWSYAIEKSKEESIDLDLRLKYREKRFENSPRSEYDQISLSPEISFIEEDVSRLDLAVGINNFDYLSSSEKDLQNVFAKAGGKRYFQDKDLMLTLSYRIEQANQSAVNRKKTKHELMSGMDYIFDQPWIYKISSRLNWGQRDTKDEEERDEDYDYEYWRYNVKTEHRIDPKLKTDLKYEYFQKDYTSADLDHRGFYVHNGWDHEIFEDGSQRIWLSLELEHKNVDYSQRDQEDYRKNSAGIIANYQKKKNWKTALSLEENFYDYDHRDSDYNRFQAKLFGEKLFRDGDLSISLELKYRVKDYAAKNSTSDEAARLGFESKF